MRMSDRSVLRPHFSGSSPVWLPEFVPTSNGLASCVFDKGSLQTFLRASRVPKVGFDFGLIQYLECLCGVHKFYSKASRTYAVI